MRNLRRVYRRPDGGISLVSPAWKDKTSGFGLTTHKTEAAFYAWAVTHNIPDDWISVGDVQEEAVPSREFRECWRHDGKKIYIDSILETAERWVRIRKERNQLLTESDGHTGHHYGQIGSIGTDYYEIQLSDNSSVPLYADGSFGGLAFGDQ